MTTFKHLFLIMLFSTLFCSCGDNDKELCQNEFSTITDGRYFEFYASTLLKKEGDQWIETGIPYGLFDLIHASSCFWFKGKELYTSCALKEYETPWKKFCMDKEQKITTLFVRSGFQYNAKTGALTTDKQTMLNENEGTKYYVKSVNDKQLVIQAEYNSPMFDNILGQRDYYNIYLAPDLNAGIPFDPTKQVFDSNEEAIAYVKQVIGEK